MTNDKGRGVFTIKEFKIGDFICEYNGELITPQEAKIRETKYIKTIKTGSYLYFFQFEGKSYCLDGTMETGKIGRLINHSRIKNNIFPKIYNIINKPRVIFFAKRNISIGEELLFDYGDRSKKSIENNPWLLL